MAPSYNTGEDGLIRVAAALIERGGRLLICQRRRGSMFALQWEFPGGKLRASETPRSGVVRELREELGVAARIGCEICRTRHRYETSAVEVQITFFGVRTVDRLPRNLVFERIEWARPRDLKDYEFLPADRELVSKIVRKGIPFKTGWNGRRPRPAPGR